MAKTCPKCGASSKERRFAGSFCESCASEKVKIKTPDKLEFKECKMCKKIWIREWTNKSKKALEEFILSKCKGDFTSSRVKEMDEYKAEIAFIIKKDSSFLEVTKTIPLVFSIVVCPECNKESGGYYEAIIQLRGSEEGIARMMKKIERELQNKTFITKIVEDKNGIDIYIGNRRAVGETLAELDIRSTVSRKLFGIREGTRIYRTTYCVRV